ncbi:MAG: hypothetical protein GWO24_21055 [Akkermansiaceae bacterium]|nr:hypothetical protein [Akkermansiaceae bacterium]
MEKLELDAEKSEKAIEIVLGFIKDQLPEGLRGMVDHLVSGESEDNPLDALKGLFGGD